MRVALFLFGSMFLGAATAVVIPDIAARNTTVADSKNASESGIHSHHSGYPTGTFVHSIPSSIHSGTLTSRMGAEPTSTHSRYPIPRGLAPSGNHSHPSVAPTGASGYPTPSAYSHSYPPGAQPTDGRPYSAAPHNAIANGTHSHYSTSPTAVWKLHRSGFPSGSSGYPCPSDVHGHGSGSPSGASVHPNPTASGV